MTMGRSIAVVAGGLGLAGCSFAIPGMDFFSSKPTTASLLIESNPPGADARLSTGGTCRTPCSLSVGLASEFTVTVSLTGYGPETRTVRPVSAEASAGSSGATALLYPNPLFVALKPTAPPKPLPPPKRKRRRPIQAAAPPPPHETAAPAATTPPGTSTGLPSGERADGAIVGWGAKSTLMQMSVAFPTDPSGVIGGTQFDPDHQFSPNWLSGREGIRARSRPQ
jgi:hypothetical protein